MKKIFLLSIIICSYFGFSNAQNNPLEFFPNKKGAQLITKTYSANDSLLSTMTYTVTDSYDYTSDSGIEIAFTMTDGRNNVIDQGTVEAQYMNGTFYLKMENRSLSPDIMEILSQDTELIGGLLDYPDPFNPSFPFSEFEMDGADFTIRSKTDKNDIMRVRMFNRNYLKNENINTPAGTFNAAKIEFTLETNRDRVEKIYRGVEWFAAGAGIVRTELYDRDDNLISYTVLTSLKNND